MRVFDGIKPKNYTYPFVFKAIGGLRDGKMGGKVHGFVLKLVMCLIGYVCNSVMDMYGELGRSEDARKVFEEIGERDLVTREDGIRADDATVVSTLYACVALRDLELGKEIHGYVRDGIGFSMIIGNALLDMYCKCRCLDVAREIFDRLPKKNVICWTSMVSGYVSCGMLDDARRLFDKSPIKDIVLRTAIINGYIQFNHVDEVMRLLQHMQKFKIRPDKFTVVALLTGYEQFGALEQGNWIHEYMNEHRIVIDAVCGTALIDMYEKCGCIDKSLESTVAAEDPVFLKPHMQSQRWTDINSGIQQHLQNLYNTNKATLKAAHWVINPETGTYDVESIRQRRPENITPADWDAHIAFWNDPRNQARAAQNRQNRAKSTVVCRQGSRSLARLRDQMEEMLRLQALGTNTSSGVPYTDEEINALARKGKPRGHLPGVGRVLSRRATDVLSSPPPQCTHNSIDVEKLKKKNKYLTKQVNLMMKLFISDDKFSQMLNQCESSPEFGNASGSGGRGDDEMADEDEEDEEDGDRKHNRTPFPNQAKFRSKNPLDLVYADLCGPISPATHSGKKLIFLLVDDCTRFMWAYFLTSKDQALSTFKEFRQQIEMEMRMKLRMLRTDKGGEFTSNEFTKYCKENGIARQLTAPYAPQQNGVVERRNRIVLSTTRSMMKAMKLPLTFWAKAVRHAIYILNRVPTSALEDKTPYEALYNRKPNLENLRIFGCTAYAKITTPHLKKLDDGSIPLIYLGVEEGSKACRLYDPVAKKKHVSRDVRFMETKPWDWDKDEVDTSSQDTSGLVL
nr:zinc finger, CCHC-type [Tanacetum cinerariifolium]